MGPLAALFVQCGLAVSAALLARRAKTVALVLGAAGFIGPPWLAGPIPLLRGLCALLGGVALLRVIDVVRTGERWSAGRRLFHVVSFVDSRTLRRAPSHVDALALVRATVWAALGALGFYVAHSPRGLFRWAGGLVLAYALIESGYLLFGAAYRALGFVAPQLHVWPIASLSVGELWGRRWARPVSRWLRETCLRPLARRGHPTLGLMLGFAVSALGHAYPVFVATDLAMAAMMLGFFLLQGACVLVETRIGVARWSRPARRAWTVGFMLASSPLFVEPALRVLALS